MFKYVALSYTLFGCVDSAYTPFSGAGNNTTPRKGLVKQTYPDACRRIRVRLSCPGAGHGSVWRNRFNLVEQVNLAHAMRVSSRE